MIKIIKNGKKPIKTKIIYIITCPDCGCEFECELEDFTQIEKKLDGDRVIKCPCCEKELHIKFLDEEHLKTREEEVKDTFDFIPYPDNYNDWLKKGGIYPDPNIKDPCETCPNRFGPRDGLGNPIVGDSPCQWCSHYKWKVTWNYYGNNTANYSTATTRTEDLKDVSKKL